MSASEIIKAEINKRVPSLDGWRGVAVLIVTISHTFKKTMPMPWVQTTLHLINSFMGVKIFFGISGFIITKLLIDDELKHGRVRLGNFYKRRFLKILPPLILFMLSTTLVNGPNFYDIALEQAPSVLFFYSNFLKFPVNWDWAHTWSLCIEEHFYIVWSILFLLAGSRRAIWLLPILIVLAPIVRYFNLPTNELEANMWWWTEFKSHMHLDSMAWGCLAALFWNHTKFQKILDKAIDLKLDLLAIAMCFVFIPLIFWNHGAWIDMFRISMEAPCIALFLCASIVRPQSWVYRWLNTKIAIFMGLISYSFYLWQQPFTLWYEHQSTSAVLFQATLGTFIMSILSYFLIEKTIQSWQKKKKHEKEVKNEN